MEISIEKLEAPGQKLNYPKKVFEGTEDAKELTYGECKFDLKRSSEKDGYKLDHRELLLPPIRFLRGIVRGENNNYVFTAKIDISTFGDADYDRLIDQVVEWVKREEKRT